MYIIYIHMRTYITVCVCLGVCVSGCVCVVCMYVKTGAKVTYCKTMHFSHKQHLTFLLCSGR